MNRQGRPGAFIGARVCKNLSLSFDEFNGETHSQIIYATLRFIPCEELDWFVDECIELKQEFPHLIAGKWIYLLGSSWPLMSTGIGFDLVGSENDYKPLIYYIEPLLRFKRRVQELGIDLPLLLHAARHLAMVQNLIAIYTMPFF